MNSIGGWSSVKLTKIIVDTEWIPYVYLRRFIYVKPKNQKEVNHENLSSRKNLDLLSRDKLEEKILSVPTSGLLTNFALISEE